MRGMLMAAGGFLASVVAGWTVLPDALYRAEQPSFRFSHAVHTGGSNKMACGDCHALQENGRFDGLPAVANCATCHAAPMGATKDEQVFVKNYVTPGRQPRWGGRWRQPDNAWFPHTAHVKRAGLACETCHGNVGKSEAMPVLRVNALSGYSREVSARFAMNDCVACHRRNGLSHSCLDCHK